MIVGGFGKSWRRASQRRFYRIAGYCDQYQKQDIGCHWEFIGDSDKLYILFKSKEEVERYFSDLYQYIKAWIKCELNRDKKTFLIKPSDWREAWCNSGRTQVWVRFDKHDNAKSKALDWLHAKEEEVTTIKGTHLSGEMGKVGRVWSRMYPGNTQEGLGVKQSAPDLNFVLARQKTSISQTRRYIEFLTIFPASKQKCGSKKLFKKQTDFLKYLEMHSDFRRVW
jgi:CRISPR-associated protein Cmr6